MTSQHEHNSSCFRTVFMLLLFSSFVMLACGCGSGRHRDASPNQNSTHAQSDSARAGQLSREASTLLTSEPDRAEALVRKAIALDPFCGPAHNNLGVLLLNRGTLSEAAMEFELARKLMPSHPDPRLNLAITFERAGRIDDAMNAYHASLEVAPTHVPSVLGLTRLELLANQITPETRARLEFLALSAPTATVREWSRDQILRLR